MAIGDREEEGEGKHLGSGVLDHVSEYETELACSVTFSFVEASPLNAAEKEARSYAENLLSKLDVNLGVNIRNRSQDSNSLGVSRQSKLREEADEKYYVEPNLWTGIGLARSGCGAALVGNPDQIAKKLEKYMEMGIRSFILSGYPHKQECELFARHVLPKIKNISLPEELGRLPKTTPKSPLGAGKRV